MATLLKVLNNLADIKSAGGVALRVKTQALLHDAVLSQLLRQYIPDDLIKAARIDGASFWRIFWKIILPISPPILIVTVIWQFTGIWNAYLFGVVFTGGRQQPVTAALVGLATNSMNARSYDVASCAVLIAAIPPLLIYFFGGKYFVRGLTQGAIK